MTVPATVILVVARPLPLGCSFAARCSARSLSKVLLRPRTVRRSETVCALHVSDLVHGLPVSSFQTPQCRSGSYSRSLSNERSALSLFRRGWPLLAMTGLLLGLDAPTGGPVTLEGVVVWTVIDSRGDRGDEEIGNEPLPAVRFVCSRLTIAWFSFVLTSVVLTGIVGVGVWLFFSFDTLQYGIFTVGFTVGVWGAGKFAVPEG